jgi:hypothetical protein
MTRYTTLSTPASSPPFLAAGLGAVGGRPISPWPTTAAVGGMSRGLADLPPRGCGRRGGAAATSRGRCRGPRCGRWKSRSEVCRRAHRGRRLTRKGGGGKCSPDRRLRRSASKLLPEKDEDAAQRLDRLLVKSLTFSCEWCGQRTKLTVAELIRMFGRDRNVRSIGRHILKCKDRRSRREGEECPIKWQA